MFGSSLQLADAVATVLTERERGPTDPSVAAEAAHLIGAPWFVIVDMRAVKGCDFGAAEELSKFKAAVARRGGTLRIAQPPSAVAAAIQVHPDRDQRGASEEGEEVHGTTTSHHGILRHLLPKLLGRSASRAAARGD